MSEQGGLQGAATGAASAEGAAEAGGLAVAGVQLDLAWEAAAVNRARAGEAVARAAGRGARLVVLPEMFATGFSMRAEAMAEHAAETEAWLAATARREGVSLVGGLAVPPEDPGARAGDPGAPAGPSVDTPAADRRPLNRALLFDAAGRLALSYDKIHPFSLAGEHRVYGAGQRLPTVTVEGVRVTVLVCYDLRFPELFRARADGTDLFVVIANWPERRRHHWSSLLLARAIENQAWVLGVNRVGEGDGLVYTGDSALIDPLGQVVAQAEPGAEACLEGRVRAAAVAELRERFGFLGDRRPAVYRALGG